MVRACSDSAEGIADADAIMVTAELLFLGYREAGL